MTNLLKFIRSYDDLRSGAETDRDRPKEGEANTARETNRPSATAATPLAETRTTERQRPAASSRSHSPQAAAAEKLYTRALGAVSSVFEAAVTEKENPGGLLSSVADLEQLIPEVVQSNAGGRDLLRKAMGTYTEGDGAILPHSVNVGILAIELGRELDLPASTLPELCLAGFVHDLGSVHLPPGLLTKSDGLTPSEWAEMRSRPTRSYEMLRDIGGPYGRTAEIAHQVYERLDGSGYPRGLRGDEIFPEARIIGTVDFFESFAHPRPSASAVPGGANRGIQMLMKMADKFGRDALKALVGSIGLFPIGSYVRLSGGEIGRVVDVKRENPMRPDVEVLLNSDRRPPQESRSLDLLANPHVYVSRALTASDLRELGLLPLPSETPPLPRLENNAP